MNADRADGKAQEYVISSAIDTEDGKLQGFDAAVIAHLYYEKLFEVSIGYLDAIPKSIDIYITTTSEDKKEHIDAVCQKRGIRAEIRVVPNRGREIGALLVACIDIWNRYEYLLFVHDKATSGNSGPRKIGRTYMYLLWENLLKSSMYIKNVAGFMQNHSRIGLLAPPSPYHDGYFENYGNEWTSCYETTAALAKRIGINQVIPKETAPMALGTAFWCRTKALEPLWKAGFTYDSFEPEPMPLDNTISHGIERILPYAAADRGYASAVIMNDRYASLQLSNYHFMLNNLVKKRGERACFLTYEDLVDHTDYLSYIGLKKFCRECEQVYVYGAGFFAEEVSKYLDSQRIMYDGYLVSEGHKTEEAFRGLPVLTVSELEAEEGIGVIVALNGENTRQVVGILRNKGFHRLYFNREALV